ncbi:MAG: hypothetical protein AAB378_01110, partial [Patescibacteria group bacterium]
LLHQTNFWFRDDDGTEVSASGLGIRNAAPDVNVTDVPRGSVFRLRIGFDATADNSLVDALLEFKEGEGCDNGIWSSVASTSGSVMLQDTLHFHDGDVTTKQIVSGPFVAGSILNASNPATRLYLPKNKSMELEWSLRLPNDAAFLQRYSFRVTKNGTVFSTYDRCPLLVVESPPSSGAQQPTLILFSGRSYPQSSLEVLRKSRVDEVYRNVPDVLYAFSEEGDFQARFSALLGGEYFFALRAKDTDGRKTGIWPFTVNLLENNQLVAENLFVPPTMGFLRTAVRKGDVLTVLGYAAPESAVEFELDGWPVNAAAQADASGFYKILIPTADLEFGAHVMQARQKDAGGVISDFSTRQTFTVSQLFFPKADLNNNGIININDWSIFLARWRARGKEMDMSIDLNDDGKINLSDFSIFMKTIKK